jgi:hypothetical protein
LFSGLVFVAAPYLTNFNSKVISWVKNYNEGPSESEVWLTDFEIRLEEVVANADTNNLSITKEAKITSLRKQIRGRKDKGTRVTNFDRTMLESKLTTIEVLLESQSHAE